MADVSNRSRQQSGQARPGAFAPEHHSESTVELGAADVGGVTGAGAPTGTPPRTFPNTPNGKVLGELAQIYDRIEAEIRSHAETIDPADREALVAAATAQHLSTSFSQNIREATSGAMDGGDLAKIEALTVLTKTREFAKSLSSAGQGQDSPGDLNPRQQRDRLVQIADILEDSYRLDPLEGSIADAAPPFARFSISRFAQDAAKETATRIRTAAKAMTPETPESRTQ